MKIKPVVHISYGSSDIQYEANCCLTVSGETKYSDAAVTVYGCGAVVMCPLDTGAHMEARYNACCFL